ncbi:hypothetical protein ABPG72_001257 [Tetrahymena utriculariae]
MNIQQIGLRNKNAQKQNKNQENKLDILIQGNNNFPLDRLNVPRGYTSNRFSSQIPDLSPKNQMHQIQAIEETSTFVGNKLNQKHEPINQQYFQSPSLTTLSYSFFPTKGFASQSNPRILNTQISRGNNPVINNITSQQKNQNSVEKNISTISDVSTKRAELIRFQKKSSSQYLTDNTMNSFLKNNEYTQQQNKNSLIGSNKSGYLKNPHSASQDRRIIQSSSGQTYQTLNFKLDPIIDEQYSNEHLMIKNQQMVNEKIDQLLATDYLAYQKNVEGLIQLPNQQGRAFYGNEQLSLTGKQESQKEVIVEEDQNSNEFQKQKRKAQIFNSKPLSERFSENNLNQNLLNNQNSNLKGSGNFSEQFNYNQAQNEQNPILTIKSAQPFQFKNGNKFESVKNINANPLTNKNYNIQNSNSKNNAYQNQQESYQIQQYNNTKQLKPNRLLSGNNLQSQVSNSPSLSEMVIYGQQAIDHSNLRFNRIGQLEALQMSKQSQSKIDQMNSQMTVMMKSDDPVILPSQSNYGGAMQFKGYQKDDQQYKQYIIDTINSVNSGKETNKLNQLNLQHETQQRNKVITPSSSHAQKRSHVTSEQLIQRKRNLQKPSYLLSDESELALSNQASNIIAGPCIHLSQTQSPTKQKCVQDFQPSSVQNNFELASCESAPLFINSVNIMHNNSSIQINSQLQQPNEQIFELAINNQNQSDSQKRQLLRLNPYKIRYMELQQKKLLMQLGQQDLQISNPPQFFGQTNSINGQQQLVDVKGLQNQQYQQSAINNILGSNVTSGNQNQIQAYRYYVGYGNNAELVKRILKSREWWCEYNSETQQGSYNFRWTQGIQGIKYEKLNSNGAKQCVNHFEEHREISQKDNLVKNLKLFCETNKISLFSITPCTFLIDLNDDSCELQITKFANFFCKHHPKSEYIENSKKMIAEFKKNIRQIFQSVNTNYKKIKSNSYSKPILYPSFVNKDYCQYIWLLKTTIYNRGRGIELFSSFEQLEKQIKIYSDGTLDRNLILAEEHQQVSTSDQNKQLQSPTEKEKEGANQNQQQQELSGQMLLSGSTQQSNQTGLTSSIEQISSSLKGQNQQKEQLTTKNKEKDQKQVKSWQILKSQTFVIQKYIEKPMLIKGRKFDMRMFVLVTHAMDSYFYKCGYIRTASEIYRMDDLDNQFIHLTNNAVQKYAKNYGEFEDGNILSLEQFDQFIKQAGSTYDGLDLFGKIVPTIREICLITLASAKKKLNSQDRRYCFEMYGFDFFIDEDYKVWLIEVNTNPCIEESNQYLHQLMPRLLDDTFKLTIDQIFPRPGGSSNNQQIQKQQPNQMQSSQIVNGNSKLSKRNSSLVSQQVSSNYQQSDRNLFESQTAKITSTMQNNSNILQKNNNILQHSQQSPPKYENEDKTQQKNVQTPQENVNLNQNENKENTREQDNIVGDIQKQNRKREKFPIQGHNDDDNLWQFMANLNKFNYSTYSYQTLNNVAPNQYHPLKELYLNSSKLASQKNSKKKE